MSGHKRLDPEDYEAAFLFSHFVSSCYAETEHVECNSGSSEADFWTYQENPDIATQYFYGRRGIAQASKTRSVHQGIPGASDHSVLSHSRYSIVPSSLSVNMKKLKDFTRNKKIKQYDGVGQNPEGRYTWETTLGGLGMDRCPARHRVMQFPTVSKHSIDAFCNISDPGFICAYCSVKFPQRGFLIKHLLGDHGTISKTDQKPRVHGK